VQEIRRIIDKRGMKGKEKKSDLIKKAKTLMKDRDLAEALAAMIEKRRGNLGFLLGELKERRHRTFTPFVLKGTSIYAEPSGLDPKTVELIAVAASSALRCEHCLEAHMERALQEGASLDEVLDVILIAGAISESSTLSVSFRKFKQKAGKMQRKEPG
jgi:AhpD family alkylhydroperoxidase